MKRWAVLFLMLMPLLVVAQRIVKAKQTEVLVIGGGAGGTAAAIQSARMGVKTILVEPTNMLGGMLTAAGVSCTDGNDQLPSGIWEEFRQALYKHYGRKNLNSGWVSNTCFEPHVGDSIFKAWTDKERNLTVIYGLIPEQVYKNGSRITGVSFLNKFNVGYVRINSKVVIDATELGDVLAMAGAAYDLGMDDPAVSGEKEAREKNTIIQDLTWVAILKDYGPGADKTIVRPANYKAADYYCCNMDAICNGQSWNGDKLKMLNYAKLPRSPGARLDKYMINWPAHGNDIYMNVVEKDEEARRRGYDSARQYTLGFIYFLQTELGMKNLGLADDELDGGLGLIPYNREGRRLKGVVRMTIDDIKDPYHSNVYRTGIAVGDYPVDHHHAKYPGKVPEIDFPKIPAYTIPMGVMIPEQLDGLVVAEKAISVTNIVNGTTRLQPVVMLTGQAAGVLAAVAVKQKKKVRDVGVRTVQEALLQARCYLMPFTDIKKDDPDWEAIQKVGVTGILKGIGKSEGWANKMYFYPDSLVNGDELTIAFSLYFGRPLGCRLPPPKKMTIGTSFSKLKSIRKFWWKKELLNLNTETDLADKWISWGLKDFNPERFITRRELTVMLDNCIMLFGNKNLLMNIDGKMNLVYSQF